MARRAKATTPPKSPGKPDGWTPASEADHFEKCPTCGHMIDCRDLAEVMQHVGPHQAPTKS
jgi:hypothetical protein